MSTAKKITVLDMQQRLCVLKDIRETSLTVAQLAAKYDVDRRTIQRIKQNNAKINMFAEKSEHAKKLRRMTKPMYNELEEELLAWYKKRKALGHRLTNKMILKKAAELKESIPSSSRALISRGWFAKFKARHDIRLLGVNADVENTDEDAAQSFVVDFQEMIEKEGISLDHIYNMSDSKLLWRALPSKAFKGAEEKTVSALKGKRDFLTIALCANASGTHKMQPLAIHKFKNPRALKHETSLPVIFQSQTKAEMTRQIFLDWFENHFKPSIRQYQEKSRNYGKVTLLLNNCETYKVSVQEDKFCKILYLPPNTASVIQPMDLGILDETKKSFRDKLLQRVVAYKGGIKEFYENYTVKLCIDLLHYSWNEVKQRSIRDAWNRVLYPANASVQPAAVVPDWQDMLTDLTEERHTPAHVSEYVAECNDLEIKDKVEEEQAGAEDEPPEEPEEQARTKRKLPEQHTRAKREPPEEQARTKRKPPEEPEGQAGAKRKPPEVPQEQAVVECKPPEEPEEQAGVECKPLEEPEEQAGAEREQLAEPEEQAGVERKPLDESEEQAGAEGEPPEEPEEQAGAEGKPLKEPAEQARAKRKPPEEPEEQAGAKRKPPEVPEEQVIAKREPLEELEEQIGAERKPLGEPEEQAGAECKPLEELEEQVGAACKPLEELEGQVGAERKPLEELEEQVGVERKPLEEPEEQAGAERKPLEEPEDMFFEGRTDEHINNELTKAFETISSYTDRTPIYIQYMVRGLKAFFLGTD